jgi:hypothetical protein
VIDFQSSTWLLLKAKMEAAVETAITQLLHERDPIIAAEMRGRVAALEPLIDLDLPPKDEPEATPYKPLSDVSGY